MHHRQLNPKVSVSIVFVVGMFMSIMDGTIVNVALPSIGHQLGVPSTSIDAVGVAAFLFGLFFLQEHREPKAGRFDLPGFLLAGIGLALALYALSEGPTGGWTSLTVLGSILGGLLLLSAFIVVELRRREPLLD